MLPGRLGSHRAQGAPAKAGATPAATERTRAGAHSEVSPLHRGTDRDPVVETDKGTWFQRMTPCPLMLAFPGSPHVTKCLPLHRHIWDAGPGAELRCGFGRPVGGSPVLGDWPDHTPPSQELGHLTQGAEVSLQSDDAPIKSLSGNARPGKRSLQPHPTGLLPSPPDPAPPGGDRGSWRMSTQGQRVLPGHLALPTAPFRYPQRLLPSGRRCCWHGRSQGWGSMQRGGGAGGTLLSA